MHVVCTSVTAVVILRSYGIGLYHKLHGVHRPVGMKKSIIKRRKRVVPAMQDQPTGSQDVTSFPASQAPDQQYNESPQQGQLEDHPENQDPHTLETNQQPSSDHYHHDPHSHPQPLYSPPAIGVDFTGYQLDPHRRPSNQQQPHTTIHDPSPSDPSFTLGPLGPPHTRKRSFSTTDRDHPSPSTPDSARANRLNSISSLLNPQSQGTPDDMPIDPSLSSLVPQQRHSVHTIISASHPQLPPPQPEMRSRSVGNGDPGGWGGKEALRARLRREAEEMREALRRKEREIEELDGG